MNSNQVHYMRHAVAIRTEYSYAKAYAEWEAYALEEGVCAIPAASMELGNFIADTAKNTGSMSRVNLIVAAVADKHLSEYILSPTTDPSFRRLLSGVRRQLFRPAVSKEPITLEILQEAYDLLEGSGSRLQDWRTLVRMNLQYYGMLSWSEVASLRVDDVKFETDGMILHIRRSKTDQLGKGDYVRVHMTEAAICPVEMTRNYIFRLGYGTENGYIQPQIRTTSAGQSGVWNCRIGYSTCLLYTSPSPRDRQKSRMPSSA